MPECSITNTPVGYLVNEFHYIHLARIFPQDLWILEEIFGSRCNSLSLFSHRAISMDRDIGTSASSFSNVRAAPIITPNFGSVSARAAPTVTDFVAACESCLLLQSLPVPRRLLPRLPHHSVSMFDHCRVMGFCRAYTTICHRPRVEWKRS